MIRKTGLIPDFIMIEGVNEENHLPSTICSSNTRMPLYEALLFVSKTLPIYGIEKQIKIVADANIVSAFELLKMLALGANAIYSELPLYHCINHSENSTVIDKVQQAVNFRNNIMDDIVKIIGSSRP